MSATREYDHPDTVRNIATIAHVDHGKTTLVDRMLAATGTFHPGQDVPERVMDQNPQERERGITIFSKHGAVRWTSPAGEQFKFNLVDTPGHADFGGEVERILRMVDGVLLLVDAFEGPMPQTRFVTRKALELGLQPVVVLNKLDRPNADPERAHDEVLELLMELNADEEQLDAPFLYGSAKEGWMGRDAPDPDAGLEPLFRAIAEEVPPPGGDPEGAFRMLISTLDYSPYLGRLAIGRVDRGRLRAGERVSMWALEEDEPGREMKVPKLYVFEGLEKVEVEEVAAGEIVAAAGAEDATIGATLCDPAHPSRLEGIAVEPPTISVHVQPNDSPFSGRSGDFLTSRQIKERLDEEILSNVALRVEETARPDVFRVSGRGELHLAVLLEQMRREGYEVLVSRPEVITREEGGRVTEPFEDVLVDVPEDMIGTVIESMGERHGEMIEMEQGEGDLVRARFRAPTRALSGYRAEFLRQTRGEGTLHRQFAEYAPWAGEIETRRTGALVSMTQGEATAYSLDSLQERGRMFVGPGDEVYDGMIVGEHSRENDLEVNVTKGKKLTNVRAAGADEKIDLEPPVDVSIEFAMEFIQDDELIEVTPDDVRLRKRSLTEHGRRKDRKHSGARAG